MDVAAPRRAGSGLPLVCGGFLLGVLWFDLMFDVQALGAAPGLLPEPVLASIAAYYRRVTTDAAPMGYLVGAVMLVTLATTFRNVVRDAERRGLRLLAFVLAAAPIALALARTVPHAIALGTRAAPEIVQSTLARGILTDHLLCLASIAGFVAVELVLARRTARP